MVKALHLQEYLEKNIPITKSMELSVKEITPERIIIRVPLAPNVNHKSTVFGGSLNAAATLACWGMIYAKLSPHFNDFGSKCPEIVISSSSVSYLKPVDQDFEVICQSPEREDWERQRLL